MAKDNTGKELAIAAVDAGTSLTLGIGVLDPIRKAYAAVQAFRSDRFWKAVVEARRRDDVTPEEVAGMIEAHADEPWIRDNTIQSCRALALAVDDAVVPALGMLYAKYLGEKRRADRFFRGACRLLEDLSADEYEELQVIIKACLGFMGADADESVVLRAEPETGGGALTVKIEHLETAIEATDGQYQPVGDCKHALRLIRLFISNDLADPRAFFDNDGNTQPAEFGSHTMVLTRATAERVAEVIGNPPASKP